MTRRGEPAAYQATEDGTGPGAGREIGRAHKGIAPEDDPFRNGKRGRSSRLCLFMLIIEIYVET
jgi:hypothetical protein